LATGKDTEKNFGGEKASLNSQKNPIAEQISVKESKGNNLSPINKKTCKKGERVGVCCGGFTKAQCCDTSQQIPAVSLLIHGDQIRREKGKTFTKKRPLVEK